MAADCQAGGPANSCRLRYEMTNLESPSPFIKTSDSESVGGGAGACGCEAIAFEAEPVSSGCRSIGVSGQGTPATAHASGLVMPAFSRAAAIFSCCVMVAVVDGAEPPERRTTSGELVWGREPSDTVRGDGRGGESVSPEERSPRRTPVFAATVPAMKTEVDGSSVRSSTRMGRPAEILWRARKALMRGGIES